MRAGKGGAVSDKSHIEWTDATWNPATGCTKISPGCAHCYIERTPPFRVNHRRFDAKGCIPIQLHPYRLTQPLRWKRPRRVFVNSLSDLFHEDIPDEFIGAVLAIAAITPWHTYQILTKRPERMRNWLRVASKDPAETVSQFAWAILGEHGIDLDNFDATLCNYINGYNRIGKDDGNPLNGTVRRWPLPNVWLGVTAENQHF